MDNSRLIPKEHIIKVNEKSIYGVLHFPKKHLEKMPLVICCHGFGSNCQDTSKFIGKPLTEAGFLTYCFDFCGGGTKTKSSCSMTEMSVMTEIDDLLIVIEYMKKLEFVDSDHIVLMGSSQGGLVSALAAEKRREDLCALILYYPALCIVDDLHKRFESLDEIPEIFNIMEFTVSKKYASDVWNLSPFDQIGSFDHPVLLLHGNKDTIVDISYSKKASTYYPTCTFNEMNGEPHGFTHEGKEKAAKLCIEFLKKRFRYTS